MSNKQNKSPETFSHQYSEDNITWFDCTKSDSEGYAELGYIIRPLPTVDVVENKETVEDAKDELPALKNLKQDIEYDIAISSQMCRNFHGYQGTPHCKRAQILKTVLFKIDRAITEASKDQPSIEGIVDERFYSEQEVKLIATRFARQSRNMNDVTSNDTITSYENWFKPENFKHTDSTHHNHASFVALVEGEIAKQKGLDNYTSWPNIEHDYCVNILTDLLTKIK